MKLFQYLNDINIKYVCWKNQHEIISFFKGENNIDILVNKTDKSMFMKTIKELKWVELVNPVSSFKDVFHFYCIDDSGVVYHLHIYFRLITGESWLKEYELKIENWLIQNRVFSKEYGLWVLDRESQAYLFLIRHLLKGYSFSSRYLYNKDIISYKSEWKHCRISLSQPFSYDKYDLNSFLGKLGISLSEFKSPNIYNSLKFRIINTKHLRISLYLLPFLRLTHFYRRFTNKIFYKRKKLFPRKGLIIAISGPDGSGKSTMMNELNDSLGSFITVKRYHLGRPQGQTLSSLNNFLFKRKVFAKRRFSNSTVRSFIKSLKAVLVSIIRLYVAFKASYFASKGYLVLSDRWPTNITGKMDGPRISLEKGLPPIIRFLRKIEVSVYNSIPRVDVCYIFKIPLKTAIYRNKLRVKKDKETDDEIISRYNDNLCISPIAHKIINFENSDDLQKSKDLLIKLTWIEIYKNQN